MIAYRRGDFMTGSINDLRAAFSKAAVVINPSGILAIYNNTEDGYISQPEYDNSAVFDEVFYQFLKASDGFYIKFHTGFSITLGFTMNSPVDTPVFYPPLRKQMSLDELREISEEIRRNTASNGEFVEFLSGVDFSDDDDVRTKLNEWVQSHSQENENVISFSRKVRFDKMLRVLQKIQSYGFECSEIYEPKSEKSAGYLTLSFDDKGNTPCGFSKKSVGYLAELAGISDGMSFEADINEGCMDITFYA